MDDRDPKRLVDVALVVLAAGALAAGAGYWVSADPGQQPTLDPVVYAAEPPPQEDANRSCPRGTPWRPGLSCGPAATVLHEQMLLDGGRRRPGRSR